MFGRSQNLYFFDQERRSRARRRRKPVDQLPFNLAYAGVSGTYKVEAYLRQQIQISATAVVTLPQTPDNDTNYEDKIVDGQSAGRTPRDPRLQQENEPMVAKASRRGKIFAAFSDVNDIDDEEDTQRFLFEENKFAAPNLLAHLGRILEILYDTRVDRNVASNDASARGRTFDNWANLTTSNNRYLDLSTSSFNLRAIGIVIPFHLTEKLKWNFEQLIVNTVYTKRQWQTTGYKHQASVIQSVNSNEEFINISNNQQQVMSEWREIADLNAGVDIENNEGGKASHGAGKKSRKSRDETKTYENPESSRDVAKRLSISAPPKKSRKSTDEQVQKPHINVDKVDDHRQEDVSNPIQKSPNSNYEQMLQSTLMTDMVNQESNNETTVRDGETPKSVQGFRRESLRGAANATKAPRTRLEKYKYIPDKTSLAVHWRRRFAEKDVTKDKDQDKDKEKEKEKEDKRSTEEGGVEKEHLLGGKEIDQKEYMSYHKLHKEADGQLAGNSIAFSLMSKACEDNGWVHHVSPDADLERLTVIEWARARLQEAINKRSEHNLNAHGSQLVIKTYAESKGAANQAAKTWQGGKNICITNFVAFLPEKVETILKQPTAKNVAPVVLKEYGDGMIQKVKKGKQKIKRTMSGVKDESHNKEVVEEEMWKLEDGLRVYLFWTIACHWARSDKGENKNEDGGIAVCTARNMVGEGKYTYVYDTDDERLLAYFTPTNAFCCDKTGKLAICTPVKGTIYNKECGVEQHWTWKTDKIKPVLTFELNDFLTLRIANRNQMNLHFSARQETYKINVGITQDLHCVRVNSMGEMLTTGDYLSEIAQQLTVVKTQKIPRTKREERKARAQQRKQSQQSNAEDVLEQRKEDLDKIFPERKNLALDLPSDVDLYKMRRRIKDIVYDWMESYRLLAGIASPVKVADRRRKRPGTMSAKSLPGKMPSSRVTFNRSPSPVSTAEHRAPSAPPLPRGEKARVISLEKFVESVEGYMGCGDKSRDDADVIPVYLTEMDREKILANMSGNKPPFRCGMTSYENRCSSLKEGCPVAMRAELLGDKYRCCRCRKREIPFVSDLAYDKFVKEGVPHTQLLVVSIVSSRNPSVTQCTNMLEQLHYEKNRNRSFPCAQARTDPYRIVLYNLDNFVKVQQPLLVKRHNVIPGMFLMYIGGKLLFADHIFNGYGNARKDFLKQIAKTRKDYLQGLSLPPDFRLCPTPCRSGPRAAWGGEIGGISRNSLCHSSEMDLKRCLTSAGGSRLTSATTSVSSDSTLRANRAKSAASFINLGLAIDSPLFTKHVHNKSVMHLVRKTAPAKSRA